MVIEKNSTIFVLELKQQLINKIMKDLNVVEMAKTINELTAERFEVMYAQFIAHLEKNGVDTNINKFYRPSALLTTGSAKTQKGAKYGYTTYILYMAPFRLNSKAINLCSNATDGCAEACLFTSGRGTFSSVVFGRVNKTEYYLGAKQEFMNQLVKEIRNKEAMHAKMGDNEEVYDKKGKLVRTKKFAIRLNGTTDIDFDKVKIVSENNKNIFELFPNVQFYDYTKNKKRIERLTNTDGSKVHPNYYIAFSESEKNGHLVNEVMESNTNVASVFFPRTPNNYKGFDVYDGDESDLIFTYPTNQIVGLYLKVPNLKFDKVKEFIKDSLKSGFVKLVLGGEVVEVTEANIELAIEDFKAFKKEKRAKSRADSSKALKTSKNALELA